ncbi:MAG: CotH kinase family protein, partial [Lachnospiraceae bacterium]|nr:CotH kinase family protein [Lachnospiraceae bacterium]
EEQKIYNELFDINSEVKISIDISDEELAKIQRDYEEYSSYGSKSPIYRMCTLTIEINGDKYVLEEVGIRMKGNTSRRDFYDIANKEVYNLIHFKISFQETFDDEEYYGEDAKVWTDEAAREVRKDRTFASLKGLEMKWNRNMDSTYMRETYAYKMYRDMGVLAPNNTLGRCEVNGDNWGLYKVYEPVDKVFIKRYFDEEDAGGDLYKCGWAGRDNASYAKAGSLIGIEDEDSGRFYAYDLKTNKKTSQHEQLKNMINIINNSSASEEQLEEVVDMENWLRFMAVSYFLGMPDDLRNNYNNHYVYFKKSTGQAVFIAYDCEISLGIATWNPTGNYMTETNPYSGWAYGINESQRNPLIKKTVSEGGLYRDEYTEALDDVANSKWMSFHTYDVMFGEIYSKYNVYDIPDVRVKKFDKKYFDMSIADMVTDGGYSNGNMTVQEYLEKMLENYYTHREER